MNSEKQEAAFHEAGHALLMVHYGFKVERVEINYIAVESRWDGKTHRATTRLNVTCDLQDFDPTLWLRESAIAFGGCLLQSKFLAGQTCHSTVFMPVRHWDVLFQWMENTNTETLAPYPMQFADVDSEGVVVPVHPRSFGGGDRTAHLRILKVIAQTPFSQCQFHRCLQDEIASAMAYLDEPKTWNAAVALTQALNSQPDGTHEVIEGRTLQAILKLGCCDAVRGNAFSG